MFFNGGNSELGQLSVQDMDNGERGSGYHLPAPDVPQEIYQFQQNYAPVDINPLPIVQPDVFPAPEVSPPSPVFQTLTPSLPATVITDAAGNIQPVQPVQPVQPLPVRRIPKFRRRLPPVIDRYLPAPEMTAAAQPKQQTVESDDENLIFGFDAKTVLIAGGVGAAILFFMSGKGK